MVKGSEDVRTAGIKVREPHVDTPLPGGSGNRVDQWDGRGVHITHK